MCDTAENGIDHSNNRQDAVNINIDKGYKAIAKERLLTKQLQNLILSNLEEATFKAETIKLSSFEASGIEFTCKYHNPNSEG